MEGVKGGDYLIGAVAMQLTVLSCQLDGTLIGLRPAIGYEDPVEAAVLDQNLSQLYLRNCVELVRGLQQSDRLLADGLCHRWVRMTDVIDGPARRKVEILLAVDIPDLDVFPGAGVGDVEFA